ncbi:prepilin-type N-terminal cleavage/methylation domain-containing protein [Rhodospirillaceae bacterium SYSU D60014]|uniref:prepilin-type N-terminal cleavage/methylation domain-containing protein n=1 Tax=Virgifigura deserti TaxID=2268457 RepID=UPI000E664804
MMRERGFTLLEMLIAMTLMALLTVGLTSGLRLGARVWDGADDRRLAIQEQQATYTLLRRTLTQLIPQNLSQEATARTVTFLGDAARMRLLSTAPADVARPGLYRIEIAAETAGENASLGRRDLVIRWQPFAGEALAAPLDQADRRILLAGLEEGAFSYFGNRDEGWVSQWSSRVDLPQLVRLRLGRPGDASLFEEVVFGTNLGLPDISAIASSE